MSIELNNEEKIEIINDRINFWKMILDAKNIDMAELQKINNESKINDLLIHVENTNAKIAILQQMLAGLTNEPN